MRRLGCTRTSSLRHPSKLALRPLEARDVPAIYTVDSLADTNTGIGTAGTLRYCITQANLDIAADTINIAMTGTISLTDQLKVTRDTTIVGPGSKSLTIDAKQISRVLYLSDTGAVGSINVTISGVTLTNGKTTAAPIRGAGIFGGNSDSITLDDVVVSNCQSDDAGGGINIDDNGTLIVRNSEISGNTCGLASGTYRAGAGIYFVVGGTLVVENSTISGNVNVFSSGGAVYFYGANGANITIRNSTISGNTAQANGSGVMVYSAISGSVLIQNSTIVDNVSKTGVGGGLRLDSAAIPVTIVSSVIANNSAATDPDLSVPAATVNFSLIENLGGAVITGANNHLSIDPNLGPLANNGGRRKTHAALAGSKLIDAGSNPMALLFDARGTGFNRSVGQTDIGAFEVQPAAAPPTATITINAGAAQRSLVTTINVTFSEPVDFVGTAAAAIALQRLATSTIVNPNGAVTLAFNPSTGPATSFAITFNDAVFAPGLTKSLLTGKYLLTLVANQIKSASTGLFLDGNGDLVSGDDKTQNLHRLAGDADGDGDVDVTDFTAFRSAFGAGPSSIFDLDGDGDVDVTDFGGFRSAFGTVP